MDSFVTMYPCYCSTEDHAEMAHYIYFAISALVTVRGMTLVMAPVLAALESWGQNSVIGVV